MNPGVAALCCTVLLLASCGSIATPANPTFPPGVTPTPLPQPPYVGLGVYQKLAEVTRPQTFGGVSFVSFVEVRQAPGTFVPQVEPAYVYAFQGPAVISRREGEQTESVGQGMALWADGAVEHVNGSNSDQIWYLISVRSIARRSDPLPSTSSRVLVTTGDLDPFPTGRSLVHQLGYITMAAGGRTSSHTHGGIETFYVLKGTIELALGDRTRKKIAMGESAYVKPGMAMQMTVVGDEPVQILTYFVTPEGAPWQTNLQTVP